MSTQRSFCSAQDLTLFLSHLCLKSLLSHPYAFSSWAAHSLYFQEYPDNQCLGPALHMTRFTYYLFSCCFQSSFITVLALSLTFVFNPIYNNTDPNSYTLETHSRYPSIPRKGMMGFHCKKENHKICCRKKICLGELGEQPSNRACDLEK